VNTSNGAGHDPRSKIAAALQDPDPVLAALRVLGLTLAWATEGLSSEAVTASAAAIRAVAVADDSLALATTFYKVLDTVVAKAEPAEAVAADLRWHAVEQARLDTEIAPLRARLGELQQAEERLQATRAEKADLEARNAQLSRVERLAQHVSELRNTRERLIVRVQALESPVRAAEDDLRGAAGRLVTLAQAALDDLTESTRAQLDQAEDKERELQARRQDADATRARCAQATDELVKAEADLDQARTGYASMRAEIADRHSAFRRYHEASLDIAEALAGPGDQPGSGGGPAARALRALAQVQDQLADVDALLASALNPSEDGQGVEEG
jgi:hypothetical protein